MKHSIYLIIAVSIITFSSACSKRQFVFFNSAGESTTHPNPMAYVTDTLEVVYNFSGINCPVNITIFNKADQPIYVDWKKSVAIVNQQKVNYFSEVKHFEGTTDVDIVWLDEEFRGKITAEERITFIPPHSKFSSTRANLCQYFEDLPRPKTVKVPSRGTVDRVKLYNFTPSSTPLKFQSLITLSSSESFEKEVQVSSDFYISEIVSNANPDFSLYSNDVANHKVLHYEECKSTTKAAKSNKVIEYLSILLLASIIIPGAIELF